MPGKGGQYHRNIQLKYENVIEGFCMKQINTSRATVNFEYIAIGSYLTKKLTNLILNLSVQDKRRQFIEGLFQKLSGIGPPFIIPNA